MEDFRLAEDSSLPSEKSKVSAGSGQFSSLVVYVVYVLPLYPFGSMSRQVGVAFYCRQDRHLLGI